MAGFRQTPSVPIDEVGVALKQLAGFSLTAVSDFIGDMQTLSIHASEQAQLVFEQLRVNPRDFERMKHLESYRQFIRAGWQPQIDQAIADFDGSIENIELAGIRCLQLTPAGWDAATGLWVLHAYGGGFISGSPDEDMIVSAPLASMSVARIVCPYYCLSPEYQFPLPQQDMMTVYQALLDAVPAAQLVVVGDSAGGNQALGLLARARASGLPMPRCAALLSPWIDLSHRGDSHRFNEGRDPSLDNAYLEFAANAHAGTTAREDPGLSPLFAELAGLPPTIITTGSRDLLMSDAVALSRKLQRNNVEVDLQVWDDLWHVFEFYPIPEQLESIGLIAQFVTKHSIKR